MRIWLPLVILLFPTLLFAQTNITGKVTRLDNKAPLGKVSVFLGSSSYGTSTNDDGSFTLSNVKPGQYELIVTMIGFEDYIKTIVVAGAPIDLNIELMPKVTQLHEVVITTNANWKINYEKFKPVFLGVSADAKKCTIVNPHDITLIYRKSQKTLEAWSDDFIVIENRAMGYRVKILLKSFKFDEIENVISWSGKLLFEELPGSATQKKAWEERRSEVYYGSSMHFFRSLRLGNLDQEGFKLMILVRRPNPERPEQAKIIRGIEKFQRTYLTDSLRYWQEKYNLPKYQNQLIRDPVKEANIMRPTDQPGLYGIFFPECLYVIYTKKMETEDFKDVYHPLDMPNYETSVLTLHTDYALFDMNGSLVSNPSPLFEGTWSKDKFAEQLPVDYLPASAK